MDRKHTPGPWRIGTPGPNGCYTIGTERGLMTAMIAHSISEPGQVDEAKANASLIAAAPDLLKALERIAREHDCGCVPCVGSCRSQEALEITVEEIQEIARSAISKAQVKP